MVANYTVMYTLLCMTKFQNHLKQLGPEKSSEIYKISPRTAHAYMYGYRHPRLINVPSLIRLSKGKLTYRSFFPDEIYR